MIIGIGSDHAGFPLKEELKPFIQELGYELKDYGTFSTESVDYPKIGFALGKAVTEGEVNLAIAICGTGIGISIAANKVRGVRAALCHDTFSAHASREHNDANILALGARVIGVELAKDIVKTWLEAKFLGERHQRRVQMLEEGFQ